jgi:hypothetical protein
VAKSGDFRGHQRRPQLAITGYFFVATDMRRWAGKKYRRLRSFNRFKRWWIGLIERQPDLFAHWKWVRGGY